MNTNTAGSPTCKHGVSWNVCTQCRPGLTTQTLCCEKCKGHRNLNAGLAPKIYPMYPIIAYCKNAACTCHIPHTESWEKELDAWMQFYIDGGAYTPASHIALRQHFRSLLKDQRDRAVQKLEGMKKATKSEFDTGSEFSYPRLIRENGYNAAITDAIEVVKGV